MMDMNRRRYSPVINIVLLVLIFFGVFFRFLNITRNQFVYYDEGLYLTHNLTFLRAVEQNPPVNFSQLLTFFNVSFHLALREPKTLWFFLCYLRTILVGVNAWYYTRLLSAIFGSLTLFVLFFFTKRMYRSNFIALLSVALLAFLPSHLYYSRLGMQEALSTFLFLTGMYFYFFPDRLRLKSMLSGLFFAGVYFTNYRMIILPVILLYVETLLYVSRAKRWDYKRYLAFLIPFGLLIAAIGLMDNKANFRISFAWMSRQAQLTGGKFQFINLFSYPYYLFRLESMIFALFFFMNFWILYRILKESWTGQTVHLQWKKILTHPNWKSILPFMVVILFMGIFSLPQEKGVRYLCVVMPFMAMAVALVIERVLNAKVKYPLWILFFIVMMFVQMFIKGFHLVYARTDYARVIQFLKKKDPAMKILGSQYKIYRLYVKDAKDIQETPRLLSSLVRYYQQGYGYLIVDPQTYISYTKTKERFTPELTDYLGYLEQHVPSFHVYPHFSSALFERFVLEHNENLVQSLRFIRANINNRYGMIKVYDIKFSIYLIQRRLKEAQALSQNKATGP